ncbi:hypothetical protein ACFOGI_03020, partial [Virgibacillus xinjiangensis]
QERRDIRGRSRKSARAMGYRQESGDIGRRGEISAGEERISRRCRISAEARRYRQERRDISRRSKISAGAISQTPKI